MPRGSVSILYLSRSICLLQHLKSLVQRVCGFLRKSVGYLGNWCTGTFEGDLLVVCSRYI